MPKRPSITQIQNPNANLYALVGEAQSIVMALIESRGELTPEIQARLEANDLAIARKVDGYVYIDEQFDAQVHFLKKKEEGFRSVRKGIEAAQERMRINVKAAMVTLGKETLDGDEYRYKLSTRAPKLVITDEASIPKEYKIIVQSTVIDKEKLLSALKDGFEVPGATLEEVKALLTQENPLKD